jgi:hypothetical protein
MNRQQHPEGAKAQAKQLYETHGSRRAAEVTGLPRRTINAWAKQEGWQRRLATKQAPEQGVTGVAAVPDARVATVKRLPGYQRLALLQQLGQEASACLAKVGQEREAGRSGAARNWAWCVGILLERAELLAKAAGAVGGPDEDPAVAVATLHQVLDAIEPRVSGA